MKIELLLNKVTQDQSAITEDDIAFLGWGHGPAAGADKDEIVSNRLPYLSLRKEDWGGVVVHGPTLSVFQVDSDAYELLERLKQGESIDEIVDNPGKFSTEEIDEFIKLVSSLNLDKK